MADFYPEALAGDERRLVGDRRTLAGRADDGPLVGVALSGGGIRSATFCLGFFQALARRKLIRHIDFLSTVSGGGYFGAFLGGLFCPRGGAAPGSASRIDEVERTLRDGDSSPVRWLRDNGRYLSPNGAGDLLVATAALLRNWVALHVVLATAVLTVFLGMALVRAALASQAGARGLSDTSWRWLWEGFPPVAADPGIWWSPYLAAGAAFFLVAAVPCGWAYWLTQGRLSLLTVASLLVVSSAFWWWRPEQAQPLVAAFTVVTALTVAVWCAGRIASRRLADSVAAERASRRMLSAVLGRMLTLAAGFLAIALIDSWGQTLYGYGMHHDGPWSAFTGAGGAGALLLGFLSLARQTLPYLGNGSGKRLRLPPQLLAFTAAALVVIVILTGLATVAHGFAWGWGIPSGDPGAFVVAPAAPSAQPAAAAPVPAREPRGEPRAAMSTRWLLAGFLAALVLSLCFGRTIAFLNLSSQQTLYGARLMRAYLGASNAHRMNRNVTAPIRGDDIPMRGYHPHQAGGPVHLINVTVNETIPPDTALELRDRKGRAMAIGPAGISVGRGHHGRWTSPDRAAVVALPTGDAAHPLAGEVDEDGTLAVESLTVSEWASISGAAFSTGIGARTSLGLSLVAGLANVRLGYWWQSRRNRVRVPRAGASGSAGRIGRFIAQHVLEVQSHLLDELLARFHGPGARNRWYLSDGGHFENTGAYELIRRRLPVIVVCDCGCDPGYRFQDLGNLARRVRVDFGAELELLPQAELDTLLPAEVQAVVRHWTELDSRWSATPGGGARPYATLARVRYPAASGASNRDSLVLFVKPRLAGSEHLDVLQYARDHDAFPQQSTTDQYFDEAQWESYRKLGELIGEAVFPTDGDFWLARVAGGPRPRRRSRPRPPK